MILSQIKKTFSLFDLDQPDVNKFSVSLKLKRRVDDAEQPSLSDIEIYPDSGQILLGSSLNIYDFYLIASYKHYTSGLYVEDVIVSIITSQNGYGGTSISSGDLTTTYLAVEGSGQDSLLGSGNTWYTKYNNIQTNMSSAGHWSIIGGVYSNFDERTGVLTTTGSPSSVTCTTNYSFITIQSTGISIPYAEFTKRTTKNKIAAIQKILKLVVQPNYKLYTLGTKAIWGSYLSQTSLTGSYNNKIYNPILFRYYSDDDVYTRVQLWAQNTNPNNVVGNSTLLLPSEEIVEVTNGTLTFESFTDDYHYAVFAPAQENRILADDSSIELNISGRPVPVNVVQHYREAILSISSDPDENGNYTITVSNFDIYIKSPLQDSVLFYFVDFDDSWVQIESISIIDIYDNKILVKFLDPEFVQEDLYVTYWSKVGEENDINDWFVDYKKARFYINANYFTWYDNNNQITNPENNPTKTVETVKATYQYYTVSTDFGNYLGTSWLLSDGSPVTQVSTYYWASIVDATFFYIGLEEATIIDSIIIGGGLFYPKTTPTDYRQFSISGTYKVEYSSDVMFSALLKDSITTADTTINVYETKHLSTLTGGDTLVVGGEEMTYVSHTTANGYTTITVTRSSPANFSPWLGFSIVYKKLSFSTICVELDSFDLTSNQILEIERDKIGDSLNVGTFQISVLEVQPISFSDLSNPDSNTKTIYPAAIHTFKAYENSYITKEATLVSSVTDSSSQVEDVNNLLTKIGDKVYKKSFADDVFIKEADLQSLAKNLLEEFVKNHTRVKTEELYNPSIYIGQTVRVIDSTFTAINKNYFVEEIEGSGSNGSVQHVISLAQFAE